MTRALLGRQSESRAQTNIDFLIGIVVFLIAVTFVLGFLPELFAPYADEEKPLVAHRVETTLVDSQLGQQDATGVLDKSSTDSFFDTDPHDAVGISTQYAVNVTLRKQGNDRELINATGPLVPQNQRSVASAHRTVLYDGTLATLEVKVW